MFRLRHDDEIELLSAHEFEHAPLSTAASVDVDVEV